METKLISVSDIIKNGWNLYLEKFQQLSVPIFVTFGTSAAVVLIEYFLPESIFLFLFATAIMIFINIWMVITQILLVNKIYLKQPAVLETAASLAFSKIPSYLLIVIINFIIILGGLVLLIIPGLIFTVWYQFAVYINILEPSDNKGMAAFKASKRLVRGRWWPTFSRLILPPLAICLLLAPIAVALIYMLTLGGYDATDYNSLLIFRSVSSFISLLFAPLFIAFIIILYYNLKETKKQDTNLTSSSNQ